MRPDVSGHPDRIDPPTNDNPDPDPRTLMNSIRVRTGCNSPDGRPTQRDKDDYRAAYLPAKVDYIGWSVEDLAVTLTWDQSNTFVESGFEVQRQNGMQWEYASKVDPNEESVTFSEQSGGPKHCRIVSRTSALKNRDNRAQFGYVDNDTASEVVTVMVKLRPPGNPRVPTRTERSLTLRWDKVDAADGYDVRRIRSTDSSNCDSTAEEKASVAVISHAFTTGLSASTKYLLCVRATLADYPEVTSDWASITGSTKSTRVTPPPMPTDTFEDREVVRSSWTAWELEGDGTVICYFQQYRYTRFVIESWITTHSWNGTRWVPSTSLFLTSDVMTRKTPLPGVRPISCFLSSDQSGVSGASAAPLQFLLEGDYVFRWADKYVSFSVPKNAQINLNWRVLASGVRAAVLTDGGTGEVLVHPGAVAATTDEADQRSTALQSIERSLRQTSSVSAQGAGAPGVACVVVSSDASEPQVDLDANRCATAASGGQLRITADGREMSLTLTADRHWIMARVRVGVGGEYGPIALFDVSTTSSLLLDPVTGSEVGRTISEGADTTLASLFDAIVASVKRIESATDSP